MRSRVRRRYHLRLPFWVYCGLTILVALAAMNTGSNLLLWVFGVMASALLVSGAVSGAMLIQLRPRRVLPAHGIVGEPLNLHYAIANRSRLAPAFDLRVRELGVVEDADRRGAPWTRLMDPARAWVMHIGPRETAHGEAMFRPHRRGVAWFDELRIRTSFPFGIVGKSITVSQPQRLLVYPKIFQLRRRVLNAIAPPTAIGMRITQHAGAGDDYYGLREFRPGDSLRHIAWKRTAGRDELVSVERTRPNPPKLRVVLDLSRTAGGADAGDGEAGETRREREEEAISLVASIVHAADVAGYEIGLTVLGTEQPPIPIRRSHWHRHRIMAALAEIDLGASRPVAKRLGQRGGERAGLVVVHPGRPNPAVVVGDAWHFSALQMEHLVELPAVATPGGEAAAVLTTPASTETAA